MNTGLRELDAAQALNHPTRHGADVGTAEAADLGLVADAAQSQTHELAAHGAGDAQAQRSLADAGRADEAQDHPFALTPDLVGLWYLVLRLILAFQLELAHGQILQNAVFDVAQAVVIFVQHLARVGDVQVVVSALLPRQADHPVQVGLDDAVLGGLDGHLAHAVQLAQGLLLRLLRHLNRCDTLLQFLDLSLLFVPLAQFLLDGLELLAQVEIALHLLHLAHGLGLYLAAQLQDLQLLGQQGAELAQLLGDAVQLQQLLGDLDVQAQAGGDQVDQLARVLDVERSHLQLFWQMRDQVDELAELLLGIAHHRFQLDVVLENVGHLNHIGAQVGLHLGVILDPDALQALDDQAHRAIGCAQHAMHHGQGADLEDLFGVGLFLLWILAGEQADDARLSLGQRLVDQTHRARLPHRQRQPHHGVNHHAAQGQDGQVLRARVDVARVVQLIPVVLHQRACFVFVAALAK